jgi:hypothetical protein
MGIWSNKISNSVDREGLNDVIILFLIVYKLLSTDMFEFLLCFTNSFILNYSKNKYTFAGPSIIILVIPFYSERIAHLLRS